MAKIFGFVPLEIQAGVDEQEFAKFFTEHYAPLGEKLGWKGYLLKADRGERTGKYAFIWEIPSGEQRNRFYPESSQINAEGLRLVGPEFAEMVKKLSTYVTNWPRTDYIVQGE